MEGRAQKILSAVVDEYIKTGEPVGSKALAEMLDINVSSATIRNEMSALERLGFLEHPHTSAGRVPTFKGFRTYIDNLMITDKLPQSERERLDETLALDGATDEAVVEAASTALAEITKCAAVFTNKAPNFSIITKVEVIPTGKRLYVLMLITSGGAVKNRVCRLEFDITNEQISFFKSFLNKNLQGLNADELSPQIFENLAAALGSYMMTLSPLLYAVYELSSEVSRGSCGVKGEGNLIVCPEFSPNEVVRFLETKKELAALMDSAFSGIHVLFGQENSDFVISNSSLIMGSYNKAGKTAGTLGVIGPMRLDYKKIIPYIEYFTDKVSDALSHDEENIMLERLEREAENSVIKEE